MPDIKVALSWFRDRVDRVYYSMTYRNGQLINADGYPVASGSKPGFDCSSAGYYALKAAGFFPASTPIGNTDSMFNDLERNGWTKLQPNAQGNFDTEEGDAVIWGKRGASSGYFGHFMMFVNSNDVIHCNAYYNSIHVNNYDGLWEANGEPEATFYRYTGASYNPPSIQGSPTDQVLEKHSWIKFTNTYKVNETKLIGAVWQVKCDELCPKGFTWDDNGIPAEPLVEVDTDGYVTTDQDLDTGVRLFKIPGKYEVLDIGETDGVWMALIGWNGLLFWVDVATATEIAASDAGTPTPVTRPKIETPVNTPTTQPAKGTNAPNKTEETNSTTNNTPQPIPVTQPNKTTQEQNNTTPPKEVDMAFSADQQQKLKAASENIQEDLDKTNLAVVDNKGMTSKKALVGALYLVFRTWALSVIAVLTAGLMVGHIDWELVKVTAELSGLMGLDKFLHDNPNIPFNGITGF